MVTGKKSGIPIYYQILPGSIKDVRTLQEIHMEGGRKRITTLTKFQKETAKLLSVRRNLIAKSSHW